MIFVLIVTVARIWYINWGEVNSWENFPATMRTTWIKKVVLIIDNNSVLRAILRNVLEPTGVEMNIGSHWTCRRNTLFVSAGRSFNRSTGEQPNLLVYLGL